MNRFKMGCILGVVLLVTGMTLAQTAGASNVAQVAPIELTPELVMESMSDSRTIDGGTPALISEVRIGDTGGGGLRTVTAGAVYSDVTTFTGYGVVAGGATGTTTIRVTKLLADDIQCMTGGGGDKLTAFTFSVGNLNAAAAACQSLVRIYADNTTTPNTPGNYLFGVNFSCTSFTAGTVGLYGYAIPTASQPTIPANGKLWMGIAFARNGTSPCNITNAVLNNFGVGLYGPVDVGSSIDEDYLSTANGGAVLTAFQANNPAGSVRAAPYTTPARHGYEVISTLGACCVSSPTHYCSVMLQNACTTAGGMYLGAASTCSGLDCNSNGIDDKCDIAAGTSQDCNGNGIPDECDIAGGTSLDCQPDGIPDECQLDIPPFVSEGFLDITTLTGAGWNMQNLSSPLGTTNWFQGDPSILPAQAGPTNSYIGANFNNTGSTGTISNWLLTPVVTLQNGVKLTFYTRGPTCTTCYADRMQVRMSLNGSSTNVGATATSVGDFTTLLLDINPTYVANGYPQTWAAGYYTLTISGVATPTAGRLAFRYFVESGGSAGANSNYIGIDTVKVVHAGLPTYDQNQNGIPDACDPGACCYPDGHCTSVRQSQCSGSWLGLGTTCAPTNPCPQPQGACCFADGHCEYLTQVLCGTNNWLGYGTACTPTNPCPQPQGACCFADGHCEYLTQALCGTNNWLGYGTACLPNNPCPQPPGACCFADGHCEYLTQAQCGTNNWLGYGTACTPTNPCPQPQGACCFADGHCEYLTQALCGTNNWLGYGTACLPDNPCPQPPTGACCVGSVCHENLTAAACLAMSGIWKGAGTDCFPNPCVPIDYYWDITTGEQGGTGYNGQWIYYPITNWYNMWWPNEFALDREKEITFTFSTGFPSPGHLDVALVWATPAWELTSRPPLADEELYIQRLPLDTITMPGTYTYTHRLPFCPSWVSIDVRGYGYVLQGTIQHVCLPPVFGACCFADGHCAELTQYACTQAGGTEWHLGVPCLPTNPCPQAPPTGACCFADGHCAPLTEADCLAQGGTEWHVGVPCEPTNPCPQPPPVGACCFLDGHCEQLIETECLAQGGTEWHVGVPCLPTNPCPQPPPVGACCFADGHCDQSIEADCLAQGGTEWHVGVPCLPTNPCPQPNPTGACCLPDGTCSVITEAACTGAGGHYYGNNTTCRPGNKCPATCRGDMNCDGSVTFADIDLFVAALAGEPAWTHWPCPWINGDIGGDGNVTFADIDPFVAVIGLPCP